jgi:hypothetical protein
MQQVMQCLPSKATSTAGKISEDYAKPKKKQSFRVKMVHVNTGTQITRFTSKKDWCHKIRQSSGIAWTAWNTHFQINNLPPNHRKQHHGL